MKRRQFIAGVAGVAVTGWPLPARAQQPHKIYRLGQLHAGTVASRAPMLASFVQGMRELGYVEGRNLLVARRYADGRLNACRL